MHLFDEPKVDSHCHLLDPARFPYDPASPFHPSGHEIATPEMMEVVQTLHGVRHALLVGPNSGYGEDNRCLLSALAGSGGRWKGIAVVPLDTGTETLAALKVQGVVGVAFNLTFFPAGHYAETAPLIARLAELDMFLQLQVQADQLLDILPVIGTIPARLIVDHCGRPDPDRGLGQPGFEALLRLGRDGEAVVKLSGYNKFSRQPHPFADTRPFAEALLAAFTPDRCLWGSDWPFLRPPARVDYAPLIALARDLLPDAEDRAKVFWDTPRRLFGFV